MNSFLKNISFSIAICLVGAIFILLGSSGGFNIDKYSLAIEDIWAQISLLGIGITLVIVAIWLEISEKRAKDEKAETHKRNEETQKPSDPDQRLHLGALLYFRAAQFVRPTGYEQKQKLINMIRERATELFQAGNQTYPSTGFYYYWCKQGGDNFSIFIEPQKNQTMPKVMAHAFFLALAFVRSLHTDSTAEKAGVSIALHTGDDIIFSRNGEIADYWGQSLDTARNLTESSNDHQFLISQEAFSNLSGLFEDNKQGNCRNLLEHMKGLIPERFESEAQWLQQDLTYNLNEWKLTNSNFRNHILHNFTISDKTQVILGNSRRPPDWLQLEHRDSLHADDPIQRFVKYLTDADEVCIVGMTHENTAEYLATALQARNGKFWKNVQVVFPSEQTLKEVKEQKRSFDERKKNWEDSKKKLIIFFESRGSEYLNNWSCIECDENFSFWGNRLVIGDKRVIRIAPLIQGADLKNMPYMTFSEGMDGYSILSEAFDVILASGDSIVEWDLFGRLENETLIYQGIANHARLSDFSSYWKPVTLVMLHTRVFDHHKMLLQKRSIFNAVDAYDKYSNISGRICVSDIAKPENVRKFYHETSEFERRSRAADLSPQQEANLVTEIFSRIAKFPPGNAVSHDAWENAAIREIREEVGLTIDKARLCFQAPYNLKNGNLCFRIYSLEISTKEFQEIKERRPYAGLELFELSQLKDYYERNQFNRLLQHKFEEVFLPIFDNLKISS